MGPSSPDLLQPRFVRRKRFLEQTLTSSGSEAQVAASEETLNYFNLKNSSFSFQGAVILGDLAPGSDPVGIQLANLHVGRLFVAGVPV